MRGEEARGPLASGLGKAPYLLQDGQFAPVIDLRPGKGQRVWVAFGGSTERSAPEIAQRVALELPVAARKRGTETSCEAAEPKAGERRSAQAGTGAKIPEQREAQEARAPGAAETAEAAEIAKEARAPEAAEIAETVKEAKAPGAAEAAEQEAQRE